MNIQARKEKNKERRTRTNSYSSKQIPQFEPRSINELSIPSYRQRSTSDLRDTSKIKPAYVPPRRDDNSKIEGSKNIAAFKEIPFALPLIQTTSTVDKLEIPAKELAGQLTIMSANLFKSIPRKELETMGWTGADKEQVTPNIVKSTVHFNNLALWVSQKVLEASKIQTRIQIIGYFIWVAQHCRNYDNYDCVKSIISGLQSTPIHRLSRTWEMVGRQEKEIFDSLADLVSMENNSQKYRQALATARVPFIPYLGITLSDLTYVWECIKKDKNKPERVAQYNERLIQFNHLIDQIGYIQNSCYYRIALNPLIISYIEKDYYNFPQEIKTKQDQQYALSYQLESKSDSVPLTKDDPDWKLFASLKIKGRRPSIEVINTAIMNNFASKTLPGRNTDLDSLFLGKKKKSRPKIDINIYQAPEPPKPEIHSATIESSDDDKERPKHKLKLSGLMKAFGRRKKRNSASSITSIASEIDHSPIEQKTLDIPQLSSPDTATKHISEPPKNTRPISLKHNLSFTEKIQQTPWEVAGSLSLQGYLMKKEEFDCEGNQIHSSEWETYWFVLEGCHLSIYQTEPKKSKSINMLSKIKSSDALSEKIVRKDAKKKYQSMDILKDKELSKPNLLETLKSESTMDLRIDTKTKSKFASNVDLLASPKEFPIEKKYSSPLLVHPINID
ncbi:RasGEF [Boothiomyces sp. JEL0866]|nr:RasGEF [Boothiomyces sp. JEL0866]